jgi:hypothetical protein
VDRLLAFSEDAAMTQSIVKPHLSILLENLSTLVQSPRPAPDRRTVLGCTSHRPCTCVRPRGLALVVVAQTRKSLRKSKVNLLTILNNLFALIPELSDPASPTFGGRTGWCLTCFSLSVQTAPDSHSRRRSINWRSSTRVCKSLGARSTKCVEQTRFRL